MYRDYNYPDSAMQVEHPDEQPYPSYPANHSSSPFRGCSPAAPQPEYPSSNPHTILPWTKAEGAPKLYTGHRYELKPFLEHLTQLCNDRGITSSEERYKAFLRYSHPKVIKTVSSWPSSEYEDYNTLLDELAWFHGEKKTPFNIAKVESFTDKWRKRSISDIEQLKEYHLQYLALVGEAKKSQMISTWDYNRYFWEGLNPTLRRRLEARMLASDPNLDVSTPFSISKIVKAAEYLLSPYRFDQHLFRGSGHNSSDTESEPEEPPRRHREAVYDSSASDSEDDIEPLPRRRARTFAPRPSSRRSEGKKAEKIPKGDLASQIEQLKLAEPGCQAVCIGVIQGNQVEPLPDKSREAYNQAPFPGNNQYQRSYYPPQRPRNNYPPQQQRNNYPPQQARNNYPPQQQQNYPPPQQPRDLPPHQQSQNYPPPQQSQPLPPPPQGPLQNRLEMYCFGCGRQGHRINQCEEVDNLLRQGRIVRNPEGKLQWPNGSRIYRNQNETWVQAINAASKVTNYIRLQEGIQDADTVYNYIGVPREDDDADSEEQQELGWTSGEVLERHALTAQRSEKVSKNKRKMVQLNPPNISHGVKVLPKVREDKGASRPDTPAPHDVNLNSHQPRLPLSPTPCDIHQDKFEGEDDGQLLPIEVTQHVVGNPGNNLGKGKANQSRSKVTLISNPGTVNGRDSSTIAQDILQAPVTLTVQEAVGISPSLRRELVNAVKPVREASFQTQQKKSLSLEATQDGSGKQHPSGKTGVKMNRLPAQRDDLLQIPVQVGQIEVEALFDTGSQLNIINERLVKAAGLRWEKEKNKQTKVIAVDGSVTDCVGVIPCLKVQLADQKLPTYGEFHIVSIPGFEVLLGRKWGTMNGAGVREEPEKGTYLSFQSGGEKYEFNACPVDKETRKDQQVYKVLDSQNKAVFTAKLSEFEEISSEVPDSEGEAPEERINRTRVETQELEDQTENLEYSPISISGDLPTPAQRRKEDMSEEEGEITREDPCDFVSHKNSSENLLQRSPSPEKPSTFQVSADLHNSYIRMVQEGASNDEWQMFNHAEARWRECDQNRWANWHTLGARGPGNQQKHLEYIAGSG